MLPTDKTKLTRLLFLATLSNKHHGNACSSNSQNDVAFRDLLGIPGYDVYVLAVECPEPLRLLNAENTSQDHDYLAVVSYYCTRGMRFEDGYTSKRIKCIDTGLWNDSVHDCASTCGTSVL